MAVVVVGLILLSVVVGDAGVWFVSEMLNPAESMPREEALYLNDTLVPLLFPTKWAVHFARNGLSKLIWDEWQILRYVI